MNRVLIAGEVGLTFGRNTATPITYVDCLCPEDITIPCLGIDHLPMGSHVELRGRLVAHPRDSRIVVLRVAVSVPLEGENYASPIVLPDHE
jgi:hypothetical protein